MSRLQRLVEEAEVVVEARDVEEVQQVLKRWLQVGLSPWVQLSLELRVRVEEHRVQTSRR